MYPDRHSDCQLGSSTGTLALIYPAAATERPNSPEPETYHDYRDIDRHLHRNAQARSCTESRNITVQARPDKGTSASRCASSSRPGPDPVQFLWVDGGARSAGRRRSRREGGASVARLQRTAQWALNGWKSRARGNLVRHCGINGWLYNMI